MKVEDQEALDLLADCRQAEPEVVELALAVALAARVEQPLLRRARLSLCPRLDAGAESALWFSSLVSSRSANAFVIDHEILAHLRVELGQRPLSWLQLEREIVSKAHVQDPDALRLEEEIIWLSVKGGVSAGAEIDQRLRSAVKAMIGGAEQGLEVARWADRALVSLPVTALNTESAGLLAVGSAARLKTSSRIADWGALGDLPQGAAWLLPGGSSIAATRIGFRLRYGELEITPAGAVLSQTLQLPGGDSEALEIRWAVKGVSDQRAVSQGHNQRIPLPEDCREVEIRSSSGIVAILRVLDGVTRGLRFSGDSEQNFRLMPSDTQLSAESAIHNICTSSGFPGVEYSGGYLYRDPLHRFDIWYKAGVASESPSVVPTLEVQNIEPVHHRVFISNELSDRHWAETIANLLPKYSPGLEVWIDRQQSGIDEHWTETIEEALVRSTAAVVLVSQRYLSSDTCGREASRLLGLAKRQHLAVFTIRVSDSLVTKATELLQYQFLASEPFDRIGEDPLAMEHFVESLAQALRKREISFSAPGQGAATDVPDSADEERQRKAMRTIPYSPAKSDLFTPFQRGQYFMNNEAQKPSSLCAELSRLAYCRQASNKSFDTGQIHSVLQRIGFADLAFIESPNAAVAGGTHCFIAAGPTGNPATQIAVVAFRGTDADDPTDIGTDADIILKPWENGGNVHTGFANALDSVRTQLDEALRSINLPVLFTGHSLGAALATLATSRYRVTLSKVSLYTYGSPLVGDIGFVATLNSVPSFRFRDCCDAVTRVPPEALGYCHVGPPHYIDRKGIISIDPSKGSIAEDRIAAETVYTAQYAWKTGNLGNRGLADHSPINYVWAVSAAEATT